MISGAKSLGVIGMGWIIGIFHCPLHWPAKCEWHWAALVYSLGKHTRLASLLEARCTAVWAGSMYSLTGQQDSIGWARYGVGLNL